jgi:YesN/AraC family two-component response regulator
MASKLPTITEPSGRGSRTMPLPKLPNLGDNRLGGTVYVDKSDVLEDIVIESMGHHRTSASRNNLNGASLASNASTASTTSIEIQKRLVREQVRIREETLANQTKANIESAIRVAAERRDDTFSRNCQEIEDAKGLLDTIDKSLDVFDETQRNKTRRQFEDWNANVHGPIMVRSDYVLQ